MNKAPSLLILTPDPGERLDLVQEAERAGFEALARVAGTPGPKPASSYDIVAYDWSNGIPGECSERVREIIDAPDRPFAVVALVYPPMAGYGCGLFSQLDDMVFPPYEPVEVIARLLRLQERRQGKTEILTAEDVSIDLAGHEVTVNDERVALTHTEFLVLAHLLSRKGRVVTRDELGRAVWGGSSSPNAEALDVHVRRMRSKLRLAGANPVETVRKVGYRYAR